MAGLSVAGIFNSFASGLGRRFYFCPRHPTLNPASTASRDCTRRHLNKLKLHSIFRKIASICEDRMRKTLIELLLAKPKLNLWLGEKWRKGIEYHGELESSIVAARFLML